MTTILFNYEKMTINLASLHSAFQAVKSNHGCAGVDGVTIERFEADLTSNLHALEQEIVSGTYFPLPLLKILVDKGKGDGEVRALCVPVVRDRVVQTAALKIIGPVLEKEFEECSFAYRPGRSVKQAIYKIKEYHDQGYRWVVNADIDAFFDNVDRGLLLAKFNRIVSDVQIQRLIEMWLGAEIWDGKSLTVSQRGIPQGSPVSPILANLFLDELDEELLRKGYKYIRYADDFIILCKRPEKAREALQLSKQALEKLLLTLDEEDITSFDQGFKYLGVIFLRSMIMKPFDQPKKKHKVLYYPKPLDLEAYFLKKKAGSNRIL
ncbi:MAG: reverse transcriptase domain-containing protein [Dissulfuribacterales bacterium]